MTNRALAKRQVISIVKTAQVRECVVVFSFTRDFPYGVDLDLWQCLGDDR